MRRTDKQELIYVTEEEEYTTISVQLGLSSNQGREVTSDERSQIDTNIKRRMKFTTLITQDFHTKPIQQRVATNAKILTLQNLKPYKGIRHKKDYQSMDNILKLILFQLYVTDKYLLYLMSEVIDPAISIKTVGL